MNPRINTAELAALCELPHLLVLQINSLTPNKITFTEEQHDCTTH